MRDIMLDLETLSPERDAAVIQIGACAFSLEKGIGPHDMPARPAPTFKVTIPWIDAIAYGHLDGDTLSWWMRQSEAARESVLTPDTGSSREAAETFSGWLNRHTLEEPAGPEGIRLWAGPSDFDHPILRNLYRQLRLPVPWDRRRVRDSKTVLDMAQTFGVEMYKPPTGVEHDALSDALWQAEQLLVMWRALRARVTG